MFVRARVLYIVGEDVGDAFSIDESLKSAGLKSKFFNSNPNVATSNNYLKFLKKLPAETVFAVKKASSNNNNSLNSFLISIPFVSSHLGLPIKIGETIWLQEINEISDVESFFEINAYYLGRAHSYFTTEDTGYCYADREDEIFNISKKSFNSSRLEKNKNVKQKLLTIKEGNSKANSIFVHNTVGDGSELKFVNNKNSYIKNNIAKYDIRASTKFIKNPEDAVFQGTYNNMISLTSVNDKFDNSSRYGNIEIIAGHGEYTKDSPPEEFEFEQVNANNQKLSSKVSVRKFNADIAGAQVWNGIHYETIKTDMSFVNEGVIKKLGLDSFESDYLNNSNLKASSYNLNASSLTVSEYNTRSIEIQKNNLLNLNDITTLNLDRVISSIAGNKNNYVIQIPAPFPNIDGDILDSLHGGSSITGVSDSIIFCTHNSTFSGNNNIKLIQTNSDDKIPSQISLEPTGNILIDGHKILIGSHNRLNNKRHGKSAMVYLGHSDDNQSLVLGEKLNDFLTMMLSVQIEVFKLLKDSLTKLAVTDEFMYNSFNDLLIALEGFSANAPAFVGPMAAVGAATTKLQTDLITLSPISDVKENSDNQKKFIETQVLINKDEEYSRRLQSIVNNLDLLLSKFTKTS